MLDTRTPAQRHEAWCAMLLATTKRGWRHIEGWTFATPTGTIYDLSATDPNSLYLLEAFQPTGRDTHTHLLQMVRSL